MRWIAALYLIGWHPSCLDKRVTVESGPTYRGPIRPGVVGKMATVHCNDVHEIWERPDGVRYVKEYVDCQ
jgi:hypothetical protein